MFGLFKKPPRSRGTLDQPAQAGVEPIVIRVAPERDFSDLTSAASCDQAVIDGRVEPFLLLGQRLGGEATGPNVVLGPAGSADAKSWLDAELVTAVEAGHSVDFNATLDYGDGESHIPRRVTFDLGSLGVRILHLWG